MDKTNIKSDYCQFQVVYLVAIKQMDSMFPYVYLVIDHR